MPRIQKFNTDRAKREGFSLVELVVVVAIILIVAAMAVPAALKTLYAYQLDSSGRMFAAKLQDARMAAVKYNQPYYVSFTAGKPPNFISAAPASRAFNQSTDPYGETSGSVTIQNPGTIDISQLTTYFGGTAPLTNPTSGGANPVGFNARGLPCISNGGGNLFLCTPLSSTPNSGFAWFMQDSAGIWEAVTVTSTGRIRSWRQTSAGVWQ